MKRFVQLAVCAAVLGLVSAARAEEVAVQVWTIQASNNGSEISAELRPLAEELKKSFKFTSYRLVGKPATRNLALGKSGDTSLPEGYQLRLTPRQRDGGRVRFEVEVTQKKEGREQRRLKTNVSVESGKFQLLGGWKLDGGDTLIIAVAMK